MIKKRLPSRQKAKKTMVKKDPKLESQRQWHIMSAKGQVLGRLSTHVAHLLIGKHKRDYMPNIDGGDFVIVTDAKEIEVTGNKETDKLYNRYSGYPGGRKVTPLSVMRQKHPERIIELAVKGMLPDNKLKRFRMNRLKVFAGPEHTYEGKLKTQNSNVKS